MDPAVRRPRARRTAQHRRQCVGCVRRRRDQRRADQPEKLRKRRCVCRQACGWFMRTTLFTVLLSACLLLTTRSAHAHHSFAAEFDINKPVTLTGVLTRMDWVNPHGWMHVDVKVAGGTVAHWSVQTGGPTQLLRR